MKSYRELEIGDWVKILSGPRSGMIGQVKNVTWIGVYVHPFFMYEGQIEYITPEQAMIHKLENAC